MSILGEREADLAQMQFIDRLVGWLLEDNYLLSTSDGGATWHRQDFDRAILRAFRFTDSKNGWAVGALRQDGGENQAVIFNTIDGGGTWSRIFANDDDGSWGITNIWPVTTENIWAIGDLTVHSSDGGKTWESRVLPEGSYGTPSLIRFADSSIGWVLGNQGENFLITTDGGTKWEVRPCPPGGFTDLIFKDALEGWGVAGGLYHTVDGGDHWTRIGADKIRAIQYLREQGKLFAVSSTVVVMSTK